MSTGPENTASDGVRDYLAAVNDALADLPSDERAELLDDLDNHLQEVLAEGEGSLEQRLGPPHQYAAELRTSAGLDPAVGGVGLLHRTVDAIIGNGAWRSVVANRGVRSTADFLPQLRPAWWIVRAWLAVEFIGVFGRWSRGNGSVRAITLLPSISSSQLLGAVLIVIAVPISIQLGRRNLRGSGRILVIAGNLLAVFMVIPTLAAFGGSTQYVPVGSSYPAQGVVNDGHPVQNIYPYDEQGHPLSNVRLYDDSGDPLNNLANEQQMDEGSPADPTGPVPAATASPSGVFGQPLNDYPQPLTQTVYGPDGNPTIAPIPAPDITVSPLPQPQVTPAPSVTPFASPSGVPSAVSSASPSLAAPPAASAPVNPPA